MAKISIIIPVYNAYNTLIPCLSSVINQTLDDIEIILINDCSTDDSYNILLEFEHQFSDKVILINSDTNLGAGGARNIGLSYANGEYIGFVDSDDVIQSTMYQQLYNKACEGNYDIVDCGFYNEKEDMAIVYTDDDCIGSLDAVKRLKLIASGGYLWSKIFKKEFLSRIKLTFRNNCILEDMETLMYAFATADSIANVKEILYCYKYYDTSYSNRQNMSSYYKNVVAAIEAVYSRMSSLKNYPDIQLAVEYSLAHLCTLGLNACNSRDIVKINQLRKYFKEYIKIPIKDNYFINNKISKENIKLLNNL